MTTHRKFAHKQASITKTGTHASSSDMNDKDCFSSHKSWCMPEGKGKHARSYMAFGARKSIWKDLIHDVQDNLGVIVRTIARYQPVTVFCRRKELALAKEKCGTENITFISCKLDDIWIRDSAACFVVNNFGDVRSIDFNFNGYGYRQPWFNDSRLAGLMANIEKTIYSRSRLTGEGGGIEVDGRGTAIITESCWINDNRNPSKTKNDVETELKFLLGLRKIIWLPGMKDRDITDAHVGFYARFVRPGVVLANLNNEPGSYDYELTRVHLDILKSETDADGNKLNVFTLSPPAELRDNKFSRSGNKFAAGYINYTLINGAVLLPEFGDDKSDSSACEVFSFVYPGRDIIKINIDAIASGGGGIHRVTAHYPSA